MNTSAGAAGSGTAPGPGRARRLVSGLARAVVTSATAVADAAARAFDAIRRRPATAAGAVDEEPSRQITNADADADTDTGGVRPRWRVVAIATVVAGVLFGLRFGLGSSLYWYVFPLFGIGIAYVLQFRAELTARWWAVLALCGVLGALGVARDWAFSGHVLWNIVFLAHAAQSPARRTWIGVLLVSLVHLFAMKFAFQRPKDVVGGFISIAVALAALPIAGRRRDAFHVAPTASPPVEWTSQGAAGTLDG